MDKTAKICVFLVTQRDSKSYRLEIPQLGKLKVIRTRSVKFNDMEMYFASNKANNICGTSPYGNDAGKHNPNNATKEVHKIGQPSNSCLDIFY